MKPYEVSYFVKNEGRQRAEDFWELEQAIARIKELDKNKQVLTYRLLKKYEEEI